MIMFYYFPKNINNARQRTVVNAWHKCMKSKAYKRLYLKVHKNRILEDEKVA